MNGSSPDGGVYTNILWENHSDPIVFEPSIYLGAGGSVSAGRPAATAGTDVENAKYILVGLVFADRKLGFADIPPVGHIDISKARS